MSEEQIPAWFHRTVYGVVVFIGAIGLKSWFDKFAWKGKAERRKEGNYLVINEQMIERIVLSFEEHTKTMQVVASSLERQMGLLESHIKEDTESAKLIKEIHDKVII